MQGGVERFLARFTDQITGYLPSLLAALLLITIGAFAGWFVKRIVIQFCVILRLQRLFRRFRWGIALSKADVRRAFFGFLGNVAGALVFLVFLNNALSVMKLEVLSRVLEGGILLLPRTVAALATFGFGWLLSGWAATSVHKALLKEHVPRAALIARFAKGMLLFFFSGMALLELNVAREVVIIGFTVVFVTLGALLIVLAALGGREMMKKILESSEE